MDTERYYQTKAFRSWSSDEDGHIGPKYDRADFERVVRLTEKVSKGDEPTFHAIMETFVEVYPEVKKYKELSARTFYPKYGRTVIDALSRLEQKGQNARTALQRATALRLRVEQGILTGISIETPNKTFSFKAELTDEGIVDYSGYILLANYDLRNNTKLKHILSLGNGTKETYNNNDDTDFPIVREFLLKTLERNKDERIKVKDFDKKIHNTLKAFNQIIRNTKESKTQAYRRPRKVEISKEEASKYMREVLDMDFKEDRFYH